MQITINVENVLTEAADVLISTANPWLNLSGGVNGAIREVVGPELQSQLHQFLKDQGVAAVPAGTVVRSDPFGLAFKHVLHVVAPAWPATVLLKKNLSNRKQRALSFVRNRCSLWSTRLTNDRTFSKRRAHGT